MKSISETKLKKPYTRPNLLIYGDIRKLTQGSGINDALDCADAFGVKTGFDPANQPGGQCPNNF